ncbi:hypothetical protein RSJ42_03075 [Methanosarcina hadiensis]|uniref:hypothetical protein n=1 Tax=Methanosarcina hadiensis TaxID=3078083 RepID=UPI003977DFC0
MDTIRPYMKLKRVPGNMHSTVKTTDTEYKNGKNKRQNARKTAKNLKKWQKPKKTAKNLKNGKTNGKKYD